MFFRKTRRELEAKRFDLARQESDLAAAQVALDEKEARLQMILASRVDAYPHIAQAWADWELALAQDEFRYLRLKKHPAYTAAEVVAAKGREMAELRRELKLAKYVTALYEFHFPWLSDLHDLDATLDYSQASGAPSPTRTTPYRSSSRRRSGRLFRRSSGISER